MTVQRGHQSDRFLKLSHDRKVSPKGTYQASRNRWVATTPNSFGLPAGVTCPGRTSFCESCYAVGSEQSAGVSELVHHNLRLLRDAGTASRMTALLAEMVSRYVHEADRTRIAPEDRMFRIHWDGDFFSLEYATAWRAVMLTFSDVRFWAYTRSFVDPVNVVPILAPVENLALYLSVDADNAAAAADAADRYPAVRLALCGPDYEQARALAVTPQRAVVCPENAGRVALMTDGRGACVTCRICPDGTRDVLFSTSHRERVAEPVMIRRAPNSSPKTAPTSQLIVCKLPGCNVSWYRTPGRGRPREYCTTEHRWEAARLRSSSA